MENRDEKLWQLATQRARFKGQVFSYFAVNIFLWIIWYFTSRNANMHMADFFIPWPAWVSLGWGFGLVTKYIRIYHMHTEDKIQQEYDKLKNKN